MIGEAQRQAVERAIAEAEKRTSGEIVVAYARRSGAYSWIRWAWAAVGWAVVSAVALWESHGGLLPLPLTRLLQLQLAGAIAGYVLGGWGPAVRVFLSRREGAQRVHREALARFVLSGMANTRDRTGILIFLSYLEHRVEIVADAGIHKVVGEGYWDRQVKSIGRGIREGKAAEALCAAIGEMGEKLAEHFPSRPDDRNELADTVRND